MMPAVPMEQEPTQPTREAIRTGILDMAFHAGINLQQNREALEEIVQKFCQMVAGSEQQQ